MTCSRPLPHPPQHPPRRDKFLHKPRLRRLALRLHLAPRPSSVIGIEQSRHAHALELCAEIGKLLACERRIEIGTAGHRSPSVRLQLTPALEGIATGFSWTSTHEEFTFLAGTFLARTTHQSIEALFSTRSASQ